MVKYHCTTRRNCIRPKPVRRRRVEEPEKVPLEVGSEEPMQRQTEKQEMPLDEKMEVTLDIGVVNETETRTVKSTCTSIQILGCLVWVTVFVGALYLLVIFGDFMSNDISYTTQSVYT